MSEVTPSATPPGEAFDPFDVRALVEAARNVIANANGHWMHAEDRMCLDGALEPFADAAEVTDDEINARYFAAAPSAPTPAHHVPDCERCGKPSPQGIRCYTCLAGEVEQLRIEAERDAICLGADAPTPANLGDALAKALERIADMRPATCDITLAHYMADEADAALTHYREGKPA